MFIGAVVIACLVSCKMAVQVHVSEVAVSGRTSDKLEFLCTHSKRVRSTGSFVCFARVAVLPYGEPLSSEEA